MMSRFWYAWSSKPDPCHPFVTTILCQVPPSSHPSPDQNLLCPHHPHQPGDQWSLTLSAWVEGDGQGSGVQSKRPSGIPGWWNFFLDLVLDRLYPTWLITTYNNIVLDMFWPALPYLVDYNCITATIRNLAHASVGHPAKLEIIGRKK